MSTSNAAIDSVASCSAVVIDRQRIEQERRVAKQQLFETVQKLHASGKTVNRIVSLQKAGRDVDNLGGVTRMKQDGTEPAHTSRLSG
jgi:hypothetical protein